MTEIDKFAWRIENFSTLTETADIYSDTFSLKGLQWKILLNPVGIAKYLSAYLEFVDSKIVPDGWSLVVEFSLTLVDQLNGSSSMQFGYKRNFDKGKREGYRFSAKIDDLLQKGFLVNDTIIIEAEVSAIRFIDPNLSAKLYTALETLQTGLFARKMFESYTLKGICSSIPPTRKELKDVTGVTEVKLIKYGDQVLETIASTISQYYSNFCKHEGSGCNGNNTSVSKDSGDPKMIRPVAKNQSKSNSASLPLPNKVARTSTVTSPCSLTVQLASKNLIAELSTMASDWKPTSIDIIPESTTDGNQNSALLQQQRDKLAEFFEMSLEAICQANLYYEVQEVVRKICELTSDPFEKSLLKDLLSRSFGCAMCQSHSIIERIPEFETTPAHQRIMELEESLRKRQKQLKFLDSEVSRIEEERTKVEAEIKLLVARNDKLVQAKSSAVAGMWLANRETSKELGELKRKHREREQVNEKRLKAKESIAQSNASWKLFKEIWYSKKL